MNHLDEARRLTGATHHIAVSNPEWHRIVKDLLEIIDGRWQKAPDDRPAEKGQYLIVKRKHDGNVVMKQCYWTGHGWDSREQVTHWRLLDFPDGVKG